MKTQNDNNKQPKYVQIMDWLREEILAGHLAPDQKLPSESELMRRFGVSRIVAVNALTRLTESGLIYRLHGKGSFVAPKNTELLREENLRRIEEHMREISALAVQSGLTRQELSEMYTLISEEELT